MTNESELKCDVIIKELVPDLVCVDSSMVSLTENMPEHIKRNCDSQKKNVIMYNAETPIKTEKGNQRRIEILLSLHGSKDFIWVDAKYLSKNTNLADALLGDIDRARYLNGVLWLVLYGDGFTDDKIAYLRTFSHDKVRIIKGDKGLENEINKKLGSNN